MNSSRVLSTLGLAQRGSLVISGEDLVLEAIRSGRAKVVFLASDAGASTSKRIHDKTAFYQVPLLSRYSGEELSHAVGKPNRKVLCVNDMKMAKLLLQTANEEKEVK